MGRERSASEGGEGGKERKASENRLTELEVGSDLLSPEENLVVSVGNLGSVAEVESFVGVGVGDGEVVVCERSRVVFVSRSFSRLQRQRLEAETHKRCRLPLGCFGTRSSPWKEIRR